MANEQSNQAQELAVVIGRNLRRVREEVHEGTQAELTDRLRAFGLNWNRSQVAKAERGERGFTIEQVALIATALDVDLVELMRAEPQERVALSQDTTCDAQFLVALFDAREPQQRPLSMPHLDCPQTRHWANPMKTTVIPTSPTEAEERLARTLGTTPEEIHEAAQELWKRPFVEEREQRLTNRLGSEAVGVETVSGSITQSRPQEGGTSSKLLSGKPTRLSGRSVAAQRGHVSRELLAELRPAVTAAGRSSKAVGGKFPPIAEGGKIPPIANAGKIAPQV